MPTYDPDQPLADAASPDDPTPDDMALAADPDQLAALGGGVPLTSQPGGPSIAIRPEVGHPGLHAALDGLIEYFRRYIVYQSLSEPHAIALWVAHAHFIESFDQSPILAISSGEKESGKSHQLALLRVVTPNAKLTVLGSDAAFYRATSQRPRPTMLWDEADVMWGEYSDPRKWETLRGLLNSGNTRDAVVTRYNVERRKVDEFDLFGAKALAGNGSLPDTVESRAIAIRLRRKTPREQVDDFRRRDYLALGKPLHDALAALVPDMLLPDSAPMPPGLRDRNADKWEPLLRVADAAGGGWPLSARHAAVVLSQRRTPTLSLNVRLLSDIRSVLGGSLDPIGSEELIARLAQISDAAWGDWRGRGMPITPHALAKRLDHFDIHLRRMRLGENQQPSRVWLPIDFADAFERWVPEEEQS